MVILAQSFLLPFVVSINLSNSSERMPFRGILIQAWLILSDRTIIMLWLQRNLQLSVALCSLCAFLGLGSLFCGLFGLSLVVEIFEVAILAEPLRIVRTIRVLTSNCFFCVPFLMVAGVAHELCSVSFLGVLAAENIQVTHLLLVQVEPAAHLVEVVLLHLPHTVLLRLLCSLLFRQHLNSQGRSGF